MKTFLIIVLVVAVGAVFVNDAGRYSNSRYDLSHATERVVDSVSAAARNKTRDEAAAMATTLAAESGVRVYQYDQNDQAIQVWTEKTVEGTWVLGRYMAWRAQKPLGTPFVVRDYATSVFR